MHGAACGEEGHAHAHAHAGGTIAEATTIYAPSYYYECPHAVYNIYIYILVQMLEQRMHGLAAGQEADRMLLAGVWHAGGRYSRGHYYICPLILL